ncbi:MAG: hypothetical protein Q8P26_01715 [Candidatus Levybacteria bacterium]|nr:hypothetical protein [Candidatus Levybacteria bacterium]
MNNKLIKICRIQDVDTARYLGKLGVNFVGLHIIFDLPSKKITSTYKKIVLELRNHFPNTKTVLVTRIQNIDTLIKISKLFLADYIQISSDISLHEKKGLRTELRKLLINTSIIETISAQESSLEHLRKHLLADIVVIDKNFYGGTGKEIIKTKVNDILKVVRKRTVLLAGGINITNVGDKFKKFRIDGIDVMTSVEINSNNHTKDKNKINAFMKVFHAQ